MEITSEKIEEKFAQLPERLREMILGPSVDGAILEIVGKYNLSQDQKNSLKGEAILLLIGAATGEESLNDIREKLKLDQERAEDIFVDINAVIVDPIMDK